MSTTAQESTLKNSTNVRPQGGVPWALRAMRGGMGVLSVVSPEGAAAVAEKIFMTPRRHPRPTAEAALLARGRPLPLATKYGELAAWEWGSAGPRVLLVHGWEGRGAQLGALVDPLLAAGFRVATFDAPGHGDSAGRRSSLFHFAAAVERAAASFGPLHAIVTHSMGGAATAWASRNGPLAARHVMVAAPVDIADFTRVFAQTVGLSEDVRQRVHRRLGRQFGVPIEEVRAEKLAPTLSGPLLVIHDENDREVPVACGETLARSWPGAQLRRTRGLGHQRILRDPATLEAIVAYVSAGREAGGL